MPIKSDHSAIELPEAFERRFAEQFGASELESLRAALVRPSVTSIRLHPHKRFGSDLRVVPWCTAGRYVSQTVTFGADPLWHAGAYYVQEASSMFIGQYLTQLRLTPRRVLDLCAAPGGKSGLLRSLIPADSILVANEIDPARSRILHENLMRYGLDDTIVTSTSPQKLSRTGLTADLILVDAPCSGEGMFRKDPGAIQEWSETNVELCVQRQREIIDEAWPMLEDGGYLIYSTCTYNREENEGQLQYMQTHFDMEVVRLSLPDDWQIWEREAGVYSFMPHRTEGEGLTVFAVRKRSGGVEMTIKSGRKEKLGHIPQQLSAFDRSELYRHNDAWYRLSGAGQELLGTIEGVKILAAGVRLGSLKGKDFVPDQAVAFSVKTSPQLHYPVYALNKEEALRYLKREAMSYSSEKGYNLLTYKGCALGFAKQIGNRVNNLYDRELMIRNQKLTIADIPDWE
ncbi:MAG: hypothetical protein Q4E10_02955 [Porphyromonas sp.]|nr:hypothetical protein [Porphyromonas sp.]